MCVHDCLDITTADNCLKTASSNPKQHILMWRLVNICTHTVRPHFEFHHVIEDATWLKSTAKSVTRLSNKFVEKISKFIWAQMKYKQTQAHYIPIWGNHHQAGDSCLEGIICYYGRSSLWLWELFQCCRSPHCMDWPIAIMRKTGMQKNGILLDEWEWHMPQHLKEMYDSRFLQQAKRNML